MKDSTFSGNHSTLYGGAIWSISTVVILTDSTISGNSSALTGGAIFQEGGSLTLTDSTVSGNSSTGAAIFSYRSQVGLENSIVAGNTGSPAAPDIFGSITTYIDSGHNLLGTAVQGQFTTASTDIFSDTPMLTPLQNNGGPTLTMAPLSGSPALDAGDPSQAGTIAETASCACPAAWTSAPPRIRATSSPQPMTAGRAPCATPSTRPTRAPPSPP